MVLHEGGQQTALVQGLKYFIFYEILVTLHILFVEAHYVYIKVYASKYYFLHFIPLYILCSA